MNTDGTEQSYISKNGTRHICSFIREFRISYKQSIRIFFNRRHICSKYSFLV